ncbi:putative lipoprotein, partial [Yersinia pestis PY-93]
MQFASSINATLRCGWAALSSPSNGCGSTANNSASFS